MESSDVFSLTCPSCNGRSRVASRHAGHQVICPHCTQSVLAHPEQAGGTASWRQNGGQVSTVRVARPIGSVSTASHQRPPQARIQELRSGTQELRSGTQELLADFQPSVRPTPPGMAGFSAPQAPTTPGTTSIQRRSPAAGATMTRPTPAPPANSSLAISAGVAATIAVGVAIWAFTEASASRRAAIQALAERDKAQEDLALLRIQSESTDRRLAQAQTELAAAQASATRERDISNHLQIAVDRMSETIARNRQASEPSLSMVPTTAAVMAVLAPGSFPTASIPAAGIPVTRREAAKP